MPSWQSYSTMESSSLLEMTVSPLGLKSKQLILSEFSRNTLATRKLRRTLSVSFMPPGRAALRGGRAEGGRAGPPSGPGKARRARGTGKRGEAKQRGAWRLSEAQRRTRRGGWLSAGGAMRGAAGPGPLRRRRGGSSSLCPPSWGAAIGGAGRRAGYAGTPRAQSLMGVGRARGGPVRPPF